MEKITVNNLLNMLARFDGSTEVALVFYDGDNEYWGNIYHIECSFSENIINIVGKS